MPSPFRYFKCVKAEFDVTPLLAELNSVEGAFDQNSGRQDKIKVQRESLSIPLRGLRKSAIKGRARRDVHESRWTTSVSVYPRFRQFLMDFAQDREALLGRAKIVQLPAGKRVYPHIDRGEYYRLHDRYHLVLASALGSWLKAGSEEVRMHVGEIWWFDNKQVHEAYNDGDEQRVHLIFDLLPKNLTGEAFGAAA